MAAAGGDGLYRWFTVSGNARWTRTENNEWKLVDFVILDFSLLPNDTLAEEIEALRKIEGGTWGEDPEAFIRESRNEDDGIH